MKLLPRRSVLAVAAVVDVALHSRSEPVSAKLWPRVTSCRLVTWRHCSRA